MGKSDGEVEEGGGKRKGRGQERMERIEKTEETAVSKRHGSAGQRAQRD